MKANPMKLVVLIATILMVGCASTPEQQQSQCDKAKAAYTIYTAIAAVREPSKEEIAAAKAAEVILTIQCGWEQAWTNEKSVAARGPKVDKNGVPVLIPPK